MEAFHWLLQLFTYLCLYRWQNLLHAWRPFTRSKWHGSDKESNKTNWCSRLGSFVWFAMEWPRIRSFELGGKWKRCFLCLWGRDCEGISKKPQSRLDLPSASGRSNLALILILIGSRRWLWVFCQKKFSDAVFSAKLLWRIR